MRRLDARVRELELRERYPNAEAAEKELRELLAKVATGKQSPGLEYETQRNRERVQSEAMASASELLQYAWRRGWKCWS